MMFWCWFLFQNVRMEDCDLFPIRDFFDMVNDSIGWTISNLYLSSDVFSVTF